MRLFVFFCQILALQDSLSEKHSPSEHPDIFWGRGRGGGGGGAEKPPRGSRKPAMKFSFLTKIETEDLKSFL